MEFTNFLYEYKNNPTLVRHLSFGIRHLLVMLAPFAPHMTEELWQQLGNKESINHQPWPKHDPALAKEETLNIVVQVNGKLRDNVSLPAGSNDETLKNAALASEKLKAAVVGKEIVKVIVVPNRLVNVVVK